MNIVGVVGRWPGVRIRGPTMNQKRKISNNTVCKFRLCLQCSMMYLQINYNVVSILGLFLCSVYTHIRECKKGLFQSHIEAIVARCFIVDVQMMLLLLGASSVYPGGLWKRWRTNASSTTTGQQHFDFEIRLNWMEINVKFVITFLCTWTTRSNCVETECMKNIYLIPLQLTASIISMNESVWKTLN